MELLMLVSVLSLRLAVGIKLPGTENEQTDSIDLPPVNITDDPNKEMYVIHAMVYQVGIITNKTEDDVNNTGIMGNQEAITFYHTNGSNIDLSHIPEPLVTNVTAQRLVGVAPTPAGDDLNGAVVSWAELKKMAATRNAASKSENLAVPRLSRSTTAVDNGHSVAEVKGKGDYLLDKNLPYLERLYKRSLEQENTENEKSPVKITSGAAVIPPEAGVQSLAIPPLLMLNNNFSEIPVPIPNTSVIHYAKVNTLIHHTP